MQGLKDAMEQRRKQNAFTRGAKNRRLALTTRTRETKAKAKEILTADLEHSVGDVTQAIGGKPGLARSRRR